MKDFKLSGNDVEMTQDIILADGIDQVIQSAQIILQTQLNDFVLEPDFGLDMTNIFARTIVPDFVKRDIENALVNNSDKISSIENIVITQDKETRALSVSFDLRLNTDEIVASEVQLNA